MECHFGYACIFIVHTTITTGTCSIMSSVFIRMEKTNAIRTLYVECNSANFSTCMFAVHFHINWKWASHICIQMYLQVGKYARSIHHSTTSTISALILSYYLLLNLLFHVFNLKSFLLCLHWRLASFYLILKYVLINRRS